MKIHLDRSHVISVIGAGLLFSLLRAASAQSHEVEELQSASDGVPAFVVTSPAGQKSFLLGVMHVPAAGLRQPSVAVLATAKRVVLEHLDIPQTPPTSLKEPRAAWARRLSSNELATYRDRARCAGQSDEAALAALSRPSAQLATSWAEASCTSPRRAVATSFEELSTEARFVVMAERHFHIPVDSLETDEDAERQRLLIPNVVAESEFRSALADDPDESIGKVVEQMNHGGYLHPEKPAIASSSMNSDVIYQLLVAERNARWMSPLMKYLDEGGAVVLVGAAHLSGPKGLSVLLAAAGYSTRKVQLPATTPLQPKR